MCLTNGQTHKLPARKQNTFVLLCCGTKRRSKYEVEIARADYVLTISAVIQLKEQELYALQRLAHHHISFNVKIQHFANADTTANANADLGGSAIALPLQSTGKLKRELCFQIKFL